MLRAVVAVFAGVAAGLVAGEFLDNRHGWVPSWPAGRSPADTLFPGDAALIAGACGLLCAVLFAGAITPLARRVARNGGEAAALPVIAAGTIAVVIAAIPFLGFILWPGNPRQVYAETYEFLLLPVALAGVIDVTVATVVGIIVAVLYDDDAAGERPRRQVLGELLWTAGSIAVPLALVVPLRLGVFYLGNSLLRHQMFNLPTPGEAVALFALSALVLMGVMAALGHVARCRWRRSDILAGALAAGAVGLAAFVAAAMAYCADAVSPYAYAIRPPNPAAAAGYYAMLALGVPIFVPGLSLLMAASAIIAIRQTRREPAGSS